jgi:putative ABC transport system permease protein
MALSLKESILVGFSDFWSRKIRAIITIFAIVLGTMSIIVVQSLVKGLQDSTLEWMMERGGLTRIDVGYNWEYDNPRNLNRFLELKEFNIVKKLIPEAEYVSPQISSWRGQLSHGKNEAFSHINGVLPDYPRIEEWEIADGRFITNIDLNQKNDVVVLGSSIKSDLFGNREALGQYITYQNRRYLVIGVMERRFFQLQATMISDNIMEHYNRYAFIPISTLITKTPAADEIWNFTVKARNVEETVELRRKVESILLNLRSGEPVFRITSAKEEADEIESGTIVFRLVFTIISLISLFVGGIVIMNIMMATVNERTREIGIRMAVGARRFDIFLQFLIQTVIITISGGVLGIILGLSLLDIVGEYIGVAMSGGTTMVFVSLIITAFLGLIFGLYPAIKASNLDPVKCLAYE